MSNGSVRSWADLLAPDRVERVLERLASHPEYPNLNDLSGVFAAFDHIAALALLLAGPDACRPHLEGAMPRFAEFLVWLAPPIAAPSALDAKTAATVARVVECAGVDVPAVPLGAWLETMAAASEDIPEIRIATALHAIEEGRHELAEQLLGQLAPDAGLTRERRAFLLELAQAARHGQATPALLEQWERVLAAFPDAAGPLRFAVEELFLIARIVRGRLQGQTLGALAGELHARARRGAEAR